MYTGSLNLKIPIYSLPVGNGDNIDVMISYDSSGFMPRKKSDYAGMNWSLLAGGRITREMKRMPDEYKGNPGFGTNPFDTGTDVHGFYTGVNLRPYYNHQVYNLNSGAGHINGDFQWVLGTDQEAYEGEPDVFSFNVLDLHGKFMIGNDGYPVIESNDPNVKIYLNSFKSYGGTKFCKPPEQSIEITDGKGNKYIFGGDFSKYELSYNHKSPGFSNNGWFTSYPYINSFSISKIIFAGGRTVTFDYVQDTLNNNFCNLVQAQASNVLLNSKVLNFESYFQDGARSDEWTHCPGGGCGGAMSSLPTISQTFTLVKRSMLNSIKYEDKEIKINYKDIGYPIKHSNGSANATNFNEILLDNIQVYTNNRLVQSNVFSYDNLGGINQRPFLKDITEQQSGKVYSFQYYNTSDLPEYSTKGLDHWGYWNGRDYNVSLTPFDTYNASTGDYTLNNTIRDANAQKYNVGLLSKVVYPTKGYTLFEYEPQYYGKRIERRASSAFLPTLTNNNGLGGGARIKKQYDYLADGILGNEKEYKYTTTLEGSTSSGILMNWPRYFYYVELSGGGSTVQKLMIKTSSNVQQNSLDSYNIGYSKVFEIDTNKGYTEHNFTTYEPHPDILSDASNIRQYMTGYTTFNPPNLYQNLQNLYGVDKSAFRGKLLSQKIYNQQNLLQPIKTIEYEYTDNINFNPNSLKDDNNYVSVNHLSGDWVQGYRRFMNSSFLKKKITKDFFGGNNITSSTDYFYDSPEHLNLTREKTTYPSGENMENKYQYAFDLMHGGQIYTQYYGFNFLYYMMVRNASGIPIVTTTYKNGLFQNRDVIHYTENILPVSRSSFSEDKVISGSANVPDLNFATVEITYNKYDSKGNLQQYTTKDGVPVGLQPNPAYCQDRRGRLYADRKFDFRNC